MVENGTEMPPTKRDSVWLKAKDLYMISFEVNSKSLLFKPSNKSLNDVTDIVQGCIVTAYLVGPGRTLARGGLTMTLATSIAICSVVWTLFFMLLLKIAAYILSRGASPEFYLTDFLPKSVGFVLLWNYWYAYALLFPFEVNMANLIIQFRDPPATKQGTIEGRYPWPPKHS
ncbi:proline-specific permease [Histoplasma capsulatum G186AR]|uniref:Proline-specific permease n=1 Tax=Ajellomyces capsulatus TaxID=5037 RepID=A0A8H7Z8C5_AJECA|nr:proline-specific permease [Histoplasma capsulatum]QSS69641.1 proline-specific permease [Histoplasma capsulatum G186AR]